VDQIVSPKSDLSKKTAREESPRNKFRFQKKKSADRKKFETFQQIKMDVEEAEVKKLNKHFWCTVQKFNYRTWVPQAREGALLINVPYTNQCYLYGGVAAEPLNGIAKLAVNGTTDCKWDIVFPNYIGNAEKIIGRYGFKGIYYNGKIFFVCGC
jgi:hypothetical protein